jgi:hypothetical protein
MRLLRLTRPRRWVLHPWHPGGRPGLLHGQLPRHPMAPRVPPHGMVGLRLLLFQAHTSVHKPPTPPTASHAGIYTDQLTPAVQTLSPKRSTAGYTTLPLHGRLSFPVGFLRRRVVTLAARPCPTRQPRPPTKPQERRVDAGASRRPLRLNNGFAAGHVSRPSRETTSTRTTRVVLTRPSGVERSMAAHASAGSLRRESAVSLPRHRARKILFARAPQRLSYTDRLGGTRAPHPLASTRPRVVAYGAHPRQRPVNLQAHRNRQPSRRLERLRLGGRAKRGLRLPSTRFLDRYRPSPTRGRSFERCDTRSTHFYRNSKADKSSYTRTRRPW